MLPSGFVDGKVHLPGLRGGQTDRAGGNGRGPSRAKKAGIGDAGDGDSVRLVAAEDEQGLIVLADRKANMPAAAPFKDKHRAVGWLDSDISAWIASRPVAGGAVAMPTMKRGAV